MDGNFFSQNTFNCLLICMADIIKVIAETGCLTPASQKDHSLSLGYDRQNRQKQITELSISLLGYN